MLQISTEFQFPWIFLQLLLSLHFFEHFFVLALFPNTSY